MSAAKRYLFFVQQTYSYGILRPLQDEIRERGDEVVWYLNGKSVSASQLNPDEVQLTTVEEVKAYNPVAVFVPGNVVPDFFPGIKVQVFHGFEWKKKGHFVIRGFFDLYCTHGPITTDRFEALARKHRHFRVIETGWPKMDPCFPLPQHKKTGKPTILFAPTFSPALTSAPALLDQWQKLGNSGQYNIVVKFHPKMNKDVVTAYRTLNLSHLRVSEDASLIPLLQQADVVVSDTSSAVTEALLMGKVVVTLNNSMPEDYLINFTKADQLEKVLDQALSPDESLKDKIESYIRQVHPYQDGKSAARVLDAVDRVSALGVLRKPLNLYRRYKVRKSLGYMHIR